jgi:hypothetical protein
LLRVLIGFCFLSIIAAPQAQGQYRYLQSSFAELSVSQAPAMDSIPLRPKWQQPNYVALESAIVPGLGQVVNGQIWKVPIIYAGGLTIAYFIRFNNQKYHAYQQAYRLRTDNDTTTKDAFPLYSEIGLLQLREAYHSDRDLSIIIAVVGYAANILDAYVYAHLKDFDVSEDLSMQIQPVNLVNIAGHTSPVVSLKLTLR